jgi:hypothetical protein
MGKVQAASALLLALGPTRFLLCHAAAPAELLEDWRDGITARTTSLTAIDPFRYTRA